MAETGTFEVSIFERNFLWAAGVAEAGLTHRTVWKRTLGRHGLRQQKHQEVQKEEVSDFVTRQEDLV